ncbi:GNAT family N-acetyltransferase [Actinocorallia longicatena]
MSVRIEVFVGEQGVPEDLERDASDASADHFVAYLGGVAVGAARLLADHDGAILGRLAVLKAARGTGLGAALVRAVEARAAERALTSVRLHSQIQAEPFYRALGYTPYGEIELEAGIEHIWMSKIL